MASSKRRSRSLVLLGLLIGVTSLTLHYEVETYHEVESTTAPEPVPPGRSLKTTQTPRELVIPGPRRALPQGPNSIPAKIAARSFQLNGRVLDAFNSPIVGCRILLELPADISFTRRPTRARTASAAERSDAGGRFSMGLEVAGPWILTLQHPDYPPTIVSSNLLLDRDRPTDLGDLQLHSEIGLIVLVEGPSGVPVGGARLSLRPLLLNPEYASSTQRALRRAALSDASGKALFYGVAPGPYRLRVESTGLTTTEQTYQQAELLQRPPQLRVKLSAGYVLRGRLSDAEAAPVPGAWILLSPSAGGAVTRARSDEGGLFRLSGLRPGEYRLRVESTAHGALQREGIQVPLELGRLELRFPRGREIVGIVLRQKDRQPIAGAKLRLSKNSPWPELRAGELFAPETVSDSSGKFIFTSLAMGRYRVRVESKGLFPLTQSMLAGESPMVTELLMPEPYVLEGRLLDSHGRALSGGLVEVMAGSYDGSEFAEFRQRVVGGRQTRWQTHSDPEGRFRIDAIAGGEYRLRLSARDQAKRLTRSFRSLAGQSLDLGDLILAPAAEIEGQALLAKGKGASHALVCLDPITPSIPPSLSHQVLADESGRFRFDGIAAGGYSLFYYYPGEQPPLPPVDYRAKSLRRIQLRAGAVEHQDLVLR